MVVNHSAAVESMGESEPPRRQRRQAFGEIDPSALATRQLQRHDAFSSGIKRVIYTQ
jgi:hypothetical protein